MKRVVTDPVEHDGLIRKVRQRDNCQFSKSRGSIVMLSKLSQKPESVEPRFLVPVLQIQQTGANLRGALRARDGIQQR